MVGDNKAVRHTWLTPSKVSTNKVKSQHPRLNFPYGDCKARRGYRLKCSKGLVILHKILL